MRIRRIVAFCLALVVLTAASLTLAAQDKKPRKLSKQEQQDVATLVKLADAVAAGQPAPAEFKLTWVQNHFAKSADGTTFVPFTLSVDRAALGSPAVTMHVRAIRKNAAPVEPKKDDEKKVEYPWDDVQFFDVPADGRISRALAVPAGDYDLLVAIKEKSTGKRNEVKKTAAVRHDLSVPDFSKPELSTSSIIIAETVEPSPMLDAEKQRENPYTFGTMRVIPALEPKIAKASELQVVFWIYGVTPAAMQKPDVQLEYNFHQKLPEGEKYFNKTAPQILNVGSLPPEFDLSVGHLLMGTLSVPVASFPTGDYRLEIKITDKPSGKAVTRDVNFSVIG